MTAANSIQMLLRNLDCDGTQLHAPSAAHELLFKPNVFSQKQTCIEEAYSKFSMVSCRNILYHTDNFFCALIHV